MQKKFGIVVVVALQEKVAKVAHPRPGVRKASRRRLSSKTRQQVAA